MIFPRLFTLVLASMVALAFAPGQASAAPKEPTSAPDATLEEVPVALLPLDAEARLAIYGQPVASEIARALGAGGVAVVVVGAKMGVPERARLIVDGTISASKQDLVVLALRLRNPSDGTVLATVQATAQGLPNIDKAASDVSARLLPVVRERIAALRAPAPPVDHGHAVVGPGGHDGPGGPGAAAIPPPRPMLLAVAGNGESEPLRAALLRALAPWAELHHRTTTATDPALLAAKIAPITVQQAGGDLAISLETRGYRVGRGAGNLQLARGRVHVRISSATAVLFDRVIVTDSVIGEREISADQLAARTAREVLVILAPHLARLVPGWPAR